MKKSAAFLLIVALAACGEATAPTTEASVQPPRSVNEVAITTGTPVTTADLSIAGMTCAMGCGGTIKNTLAKLPGVAGTEILFTDADNTNHAVVTYDPAKVSDDDMVKAIQGIHEGQYKVLAVGITKQVLKEGTSEAPAKAAEEQQVHASALPDIVLPSLIGLLEHLVGI